MYTFQLQPAVPDMNALRAAAAASVNYTPADIQTYMETDAFMQAEIDERGGYDYAELSLEDKRELIGIGDTVRYHRQSYGFLDGTVTQVDLQTDRAEIRFADEFGVRKHWCALRYLQLLLKRGAAALESEVR